MQEEFFVKVNTFKQILHNEFYIKMLNCISSQPHLCSCYKQKTLHTLII